MFSFLKKKISICEKNSGWRNLDAAASGVRLRVKLDPEGTGKKVTG